MSLNNHVFTEEMIHLIAFGYLRSHSSNPNDIGTIVAKYTPDSILLPSILDRFIKNDCDNESTKLYYCYFLKRTLQLERQTTFHNTNANHIVASGALKKIFECLKDSNNDDNKEISDKLQYFAAYILSCLHFSGGCASQTRSDILTSDGLINLVKLTLSCNDKIAAKSIRALGCISIDSVEYTNIMLKLNIIKNLQSKLNHVCVLAGKYIFKYNINELDLNNYRVFGKFTVLAQYIARTLRDVTLYNHPNDDQIGCAQVTGSLMHNYFDEIIELLTDLSDLANLVKETVDNNINTCEIDNVMKCVCDSFLNIYDYNHAIKNNDINDNDNNSGHVQLSIQNINSMLHTMFNVLNSGQWQVYIKARAMKLFRLVSGHNNDCKYKRCSLIACENSLRIMPLLLNAICNNCKSANIRIDGQTATEIYGKLMKEICLTLINVASYDNGWFMDDILKSNTLSLLLEILQNSKNRYTYHRIKQFEVCTFELCLWSVSNCVINATDKQINDYLIDIEEILSLFLNNYCKFLCVASESEDKFICDEIKLCLRDVMVAFAKIFKSLASGERNINNGENHASLFQVSAFLNFINKMMALREKKLDAMSMKTLNSLANDLNDQYIELKTKM